MANRTYPDPDREALAAFVERTRELLEEIATTGGPIGGPIFIPRDLRPTLLAAWPEVDADLRALTARIATASDAELDLHGLRGPQLQFKLAVINRLWQRFRNKKVLKWLLKLLKAIDNLLDSLAALFKVGSMTKEIKTALEDLIEEIAADAPERDE